MEVVLEYCDFLEMCSNKYRQECESLVNHTDTEAMVLEAHLAKEIHSAHTGILRYNFELSKKLD